MTIILKLNTDSWQNIKHLLKAKYPFLTDSDMEFNGDEQFLMEKIAAKLKLPVDEIRALLFRMKAGVSFEEAIPENVAVV